MRMAPSVWRTAWYEEGLSERFVQEMSRLEKAAIRDLSTSAEWVEQLVIELGQLTQNMIHLEGELPRPHQLKLAFERALKLAALSAHLMAALDQAMDHGPSVLRYSESGNAGTQPPAVPPHLNPTPMVPSGHAPVDLRPLESVQAPMSAASTHPQALAAAPPAQPPQSLRPSAQAQVGVMRQSSASPRPTASESRTPAKNQPFFSNLMDISEPMIQNSPSPMREMILALSRRVLSRSEIEVITEQPRHIIEAVLQHGG
jgi:hypothetical protein